MANTKPSLEDLRKKHGLSNNKQSTYNKSEEKNQTSLEEIRKKHGLSSNNKSDNGEQSNSVPSLEDLRKKHIFKPQETSQVKVSNPELKLDYSTVVKYLNDKGITGASGIMTKHEWARRKGKDGSTYQDYLKSQINKAENGNKIYSSFYFPLLTPATKQAGPTNNLQGPVNMAPYATSLPSDEDVKKSVNLDNLQKEIESLEDIEAKANKYEYDIKIYTNRANTIKHRGNGLKTDSVYDQKIKDTEAEYKKFLLDNGFEDINDLKNKIAGKKQYKNSAKYIQDRVALENSIRAEDDFYEYVAKGETLGDEGKNLVAYYRKNPEKLEVVEPVWSHEQNEYSDKTVDEIIMARRFAEYGTKEQIEIYNAYLGKGDIENAKKYRKYVEKSLNDAEGKDIAKKQDHTFEKIAFGVTAGFDQFVQGTSNLFNTSDEYIPSSPIQVASGYVRESLKNTGPEILGSSLGQGIYDLLNTTSNMLPSIGASCLANAIVPGSGAFVGTALVGGSAAGNSYQEKLNAGWDKKQARTYSTIVGVSEASLQYVLGGIGRLGGITGNSARAIAKGIDNAALRFVTTYGIKMTAEGFEEALQEVLNPFFENIALGYQKNEFSDIEWEQVAYSGMLGALSAGFLEGVNTSSEVFGENSSAKEIGVTLRKGGYTTRMLELASLSPDGSATHDLYSQYTKKGINAENISDLQLGRLFVNLESDSKNTLSKRKIKPEQEQSARATLNKLISMRYRTSTPVEAKPYGKATTPTLPASLEQAAREVVESRNKKSGKMSAETLDALTADNQPITAEEVKAVTRLGENGSKLIAEIANEDGITFSQAESKVKGAYLEGLTNSENNGENISDPQQKMAFNAGRQDRIMQDAQRQAEAKNATVYDGTFHENEYTKEFSKAEKKMISTFAKILKMDIDTLDKIIANKTYDEFGNEIEHEANARHDDGKLTISNNRDALAVVYRMVLHESGHRMSQFATKEWGVLMNALYQRAEQSGRRAKLGVSNVSMFDMVKNQHDEAGISMETLSYIEEVAVRELETIFNSAKEFNKWYAEISANPELKGNWQKFCDWISQVIEDIKKVFMSEGKKAELAELERIRGLFAETIKASETAAQERETELSNKTSVDNNVDNTTTTETKSEAVSKENVSDNKEKTTNKKTVKDETNTMASEHNKLDGVDENVSFSLKDLGYENKTFDFEITQSDINEYVENAYLNKNEKSYIKFLKVKDDLIDEVSSDVDITGYSHALRDNDIRHIRNSHGEKTNEKYPVTEADIELIPFVVENYDKVFYKTNANGAPGLTYVKVMPQDVIYYVEAITTEYNGEKLLVNKQMVKAGIDSIPNLYGLIDAINKKQSSSQYLADLDKIRKAYVQDVKENYSNKRVPQNSKSVKSDFSLKVNEKEKTINESMTMEQAKDMIQRAFVLGKIIQRFDAEYINANEWLEGEGANAVALEIKKYWILHQKFLNKIQGLVDEEFNVEDIIKAYANGTLTGKVKQSPVQRLDISKTTNATDTRVFAPKDIKNAQEIYKVASERKTNTNRNKVNQARADIIMFSHNRGAAEILGLTQSELNKKLITWARYTARAKEVSMRINEGASMFNRWTGIENSNLLNRATVSGSELDNLVNEVKGDSNGWQRSYIMRTILALDIHLDYSELNFEFVGNPKTIVGKSVKGIYDNSKRKITVKYNSPHTVSHEIGHFVDFQWARDFGLVNQALTDGFGRDRQTDADVMQFLTNFDEFIEQIENVADLSDEYTMGRREVFARFVSKFVQWVDLVANGSRSYEQEYLSYNDRFTTSHFIEFAKLLQEKSLLDAKKFENASYSLKETETNLTENTDDDKIQSEQYGVMWTLGKDVLDDSEVSAFYEKISETKNNNYKNYHKASDGQLIYEVDDKLIYTDGDYDYPQISTVVSFNTKDRNIIEYGKECVYDGEKYGFSLEDSLEIGSIVYGKEIATVSSFRDSEASERQIGRGKGKNSTEVNRRSQKDVTKNYNSNTNYSLKNSADADIDGSLDARDIVSYVPIRKVKMKVFPPYDESKSDANEWSTRWAHREEVETGAQKIAFYHDGCYVIEKYDSTELKYLIVGVINYNDYNTVREELKDERNRQKQSQEKMAHIVSGRNGRGNSNGGRRPSPDNSSVEHGREDREVWRLDRKQDGKRQIQSDIGRSDEYDSEDRQTRGLTNDTQSSFYSLKQWHTGLSKSQVEMIEKWIRRAGKPGSKKIAKDAYWYSGKLDRRDLFVLYSTEDTDSPTILYLARGKQAKLELGILMNLLEEYENGESIGGKSAYVSWVSGSGWVQQSNSNKNNLQHVGAGQNNKNVGVLPGQSKGNGSPAFRNVVEDIFRVKGTKNSKQSKKTSNSLKTLDNRAPSEIMTEFLDIVEDLENGKKSAVSKLSKYVDNGMITTKYYDELIEQYGAIPSGERPHREVQVPKNSADGKKVSQTVRTILEAKVTPDEAIPTIEKMVEDGVFSYDEYSDKQAIEKAESDIKEYGWTKSLNDWLKDVEKGVVSKQHTAMGWALYNNSANLAKTTTSETEKKTAIETSLNILDAMVKHQRSAAQALQATRILKKLSPETQLYGVQKSVQTLQKEIADKYGKRAPNLKINEELAEQFLNAKTQEERLDAEIEIYKDIGRQLPADLLDKWNAWRYLAMLGNLRTHVRNILGNAFFAPIVFAKDLTATAIETAVYRISEKKIVRGKALITGSKSDKELLKAAWNDYANVADLISNGGKYNDSAIANQYIEEGRTIFKSKLLEASRKGNSKLLEKEDMWFSKPHYAYALAQYCKANNITAEQIERGKAIGPARDYAVKEAQKATYRDTNAFSQFVSDLGRNGKKKNIVEKGVGIATEGISPFRKTPANILVRGVEYSPLGLAKSLSYDLVQVSKGKMSATEAIDNISAGLTGTGLLALGVLLAAQCLVRGHGEDDEKEKDFKELMSHQAYSLELPNGTSITLDWLAPEAIPFFIGVNIWESTKGSNEEVSLSAILKSISGITEPLLETSYLQGINNVLESIGYAKSNDTSAIASVLVSAVTSYLMQGVPTLFGQIERTSEKNRMATYTEKNNFLTGDMQYTLGKLSAKIPFVDYQQIPYIDAWGRKEASGTALKRGFNNFLNPAYISTIDTSNMEKELLRLYEKTGEDAVFPSRANKYFTVDGVRKDLTADEYVKYATLKGQKSYKLISDLVKSKAYKTLGDGEKVKAIDEAYAYADQKAKQAISNYKPDTWVKKADEFGLNVGNYISFRAEVSNAKKENGDKISKEEVVDIILDMAQNDSETWKMYLSMYDSDRDKYAYEKGIQGHDYMNFITTLNKYDKPTKAGKYGTYTQEEAYYAIKSLNGLSRQEKAVLWQSVNSNWKASNNPFR